jgi:hypothetical protein
MGFSLLAPLFLAGVAALAVPILIHLSQKTKKTAVPFPSLMFLTKVPYKETRKQKIRNWFVFLLRAAVLLMLILAFARPLVDGALAGGVSMVDAREVVVLLDRSFSMDYGDRWEQALRAARNVVAGLGPEDRATIVTFAERAETLQPNGRDAVALAAVLDRVELGHGATRYGPAIDLAEQVLRESQLPRREVVIISDFQRAGWDEDTDALLPPGTQLTRVNLGDPEASNVAISEVRFERSYRDGRERVAISVRISNLGTDAVSELPVQVEINGESAATRIVNIAANDAETVRFPGVALPDRPVRGLVRAGDDRLPLDNQFRFTLSPGQALSILVLQHPNATRDASLYVERALRIGSEPPHRVTVKSAAAFAASDLQGQSVVILNDAPFPTGSQGERLREFITTGGGLLLAAGGRGSANEWRDALGSSIPASSGRPIDRLSDRGGTLAVTDYDHPVFEVFSAPRSGDLSQTRFYRYRPLSETDSVAVIARFDDGAIALASSDLGDGRVLLWTSDLTNSWNDLPIQPVFLPFMHQVVRYLSDYAPRPPAYTSGEVLDLAGPLSELDLGEAGDRTGQVVVVAPSGQRDLFSLDGAEILLRMEEAGFYELRSVGRGGNVLHAVAVNVDPRESDLTMLDEEEFASAVTAPGDSPTSGTLVATLTPVERERRQALWRYLLIAVLVVLTVESLASNRIVRWRLKE